MSSHSVYKNGSTKTTIKLRHFVKIQKLVESSELKVVLRVIERVRGDGVHRMMRLGRTEQAVMRVRFCTRQLAVTILIGRCHQENRPQGQRFARTGDTLRFIDVSRIDFT